jgi:hypothetical protein
MVSEKVYKGKEKKAEVYPIIMSSDNSDMEEIEIDNHLLEQPFAPSSTSTFSLLHDTSASSPSGIMIPRSTSTLDPTAFSVIATDGSGTSSPSAPEVLPTIPTPPLIASPLPKKAAFTSFDESLANPYGLGRKYTF